MPHGPTPPAPVCPLCPVQAFIVFDTHDEARRATSKDRETFGQDKFGDRYVRVCECVDHPGASCQLGMGGWRKALFGKRLGSQH